MSTDEKNTHEKESADSRITSEKSIESTTESKPRKLSFSELQCNFCRRVMKLEEKGFVICKTCSHTIYCCEECMKKDFEAHSKNCLQGEIYGGFSLTTPPSDVSDLHISTEEEKCPFKKINENSTNREQRSDENENDSMNSPFNAFAVLNFQPSPQSLPTPSPRSVSGNESSPDILDFIEGRRHFAENKREMVNLKEREKIRELQKLDTSYRKPLPLYVTRGNGSSKEREERSPESSNSGNKRFDAFKILDILPSPQPFPSPPNKSDTSESDS